MVIESVPLVEWKNPWTHIGAKNDVHTDKEDD